MKESAYNVCARDPDGNYYLFNTRRGAAHVMTACAYESYWVAANRASGLEDATETLRDLIDKGFLVDNDADELSEIVSAHQKARQSREGLELLIAPSMACNLDCFYCFESNRYAGRMSAAVESNVVRLVRRYFDSGTKRLDVTWYGGEPLLAFSVVERLSERFIALCGEFGREYSAEIVTNGTLMSDEKAQLLASWKVKRAQITLDGVPELHDARRVPKNRKPTFCRILDGIEAAAVHMHVTVRINVCRKVAARLEELLQILAARGLNRVVSVYVAPLQQVQDRKTLPPHESQPFPSSVAPQPGGEQLDALDDREAADLELRFVDLLWKYGFAVSNRLPEPRCTTCMADREHSWLIEANGDVQKCYWTAGLRAEAAGHLTEDGIVPRDPYRKMARLDCVQKCWLRAMHHVAHLHGPLPAQAPEPQIRPLPTLQAQLGSCAGARRWSAGWTTGSCSIAIGRRESQRAHWFAGVQYQDVYIIPAILGSAALLILAVGFMKGAEFFDEDRVTRR